MSESDLTKVDYNIWFCDGPDVDFYSFDYPTRMVIVRLPGETLWLWSPISITDDIRKSVDNLGRVAHLVSPNPIHHLYLSEWKQAYPDAKLWGPASTVKKRKDLAFDGVLDGMSPDDWQGVFAMFHFTGSVFLDELAFVHLPSRTVIFADLSEHFSEEYIRHHWTWWQRPIARVWGIMEGKGHAPLEWRLSWLKKTDARKHMNDIIALAPEKVIMAHGVWVKKNATAFLKKAFNWLL